jgi:PGF-pre-PGF domain-containing protein
MKTKIIFTFIILLTLPLVSAVLQLPAGFYGTATINGRPLPVNSVITARINGELVGEVTINTAGLYGNDVLDRLEAQESNGSIITFHAQTPSMENFIEADQNANWVAGEVFELDLTFNGQEIPKIQTTPPAPAGGGGGGGGGGSAAPQNQKTQFFSSLQPNEPGLITIDNDNIDVTEVQFYTVAAINNAQLTVKQLSGKPTGAPPVSDVYSFFEITTDNVEELSRAFIEFHIPISWITDNKLDRDSVVLWRLVDNEWQALETSYVNQDATYYNYAAETPGFSFFAINAERAEEEVVVQQVVEQDDELQTVKETSEIEESLEGIEQVTGESEEESRLLLFIIAGMAVVIIGLVLFLIIKK